MVIILCRCKVLIASARDSEVIFEPDSASPNISANRFLRQNSFDNIVAANAGAPIK
jgi:hypothetical protein